MNATKTELLKALCEHPENDTFMAKDSTVEQRIALIELEEESLIECKYRTDEKGKPSDFWNMRITSYGRDVLNDIENRPKRELNYVAWTFSLGFVVFVFGALWKILTLYDLLPS